MKQNAKIFSTIKNAAQLLQRTIDLVEVQRSSAIAEWDFCTKSKRNQTFAIKFTKGNGNFASLRF